MAKPTFKLAPNQVVDRKWDILVEEYAEELKIKTCSTCAKFKLNFGEFPCCVGDRKERSLPDHALDKTAWCREKGWAECWVPKPIFTIKAFADHHQELNQFKPSDYYEVYQHFTGGVKKVRDGWFGTKEVKECFYYILKNGEGYYCKEKPFGSYHFEKYFIPLAEYSKVWSKCLVTFPTPEEAITQCELLSSWSNKHGNLVFSTADPLESRFRELEADQSKTSRKNGLKKP